MVPRAPVCRWLPEGRSAKRLLLDFRKDFGVAEEVIFVVADFDSVAAPAGEQNTVARLHGHWGELPILVSRTGPHSDDGRFGEWAVCRARRQEDARRGLAFGFEPLDEDTVEERKKRLDRLEGGLCCHCFRR